MAVTNTLAFYVMATITAIVQNLRLSPNVKMTHIKCLNYYNIDVNYGKNVL
jgi:hypothetical protein